jgi:serine protease Do
MKRLKKGLLFFMVLFLAGGLLGYGSNSATAKKGTETIMVPANFKELAETARPAVVNIRTVKTLKDGGRVFRHFFGNPFGEKNPFHSNPRGFGPQPPPEFKQRSLGSGFIVDREGYIVTNNHVIENAEEITVKRSNGKEYKATVVGRDPNTDLALIRIKGASDLVPLSMGDSDNLQVGSWVVAIGSPFGLEQTVTAGIVSAKGRTIGAGPYDDFIQTDASINPGNSGGPLINMNGEVVGVNTAIVASGQGIGFAIPVNLAKGIVEQLKANGKVVRGWLGVGIQDLSDDLSEYYGVKDKKGVLVTQVYRGDPADKGGIKSKDIITAVDGKKVASSRELSREIANLPVGKKTEITILRDGSEKNVEVTLARRPDSGMRAQLSPQGSDDMGLTVAELTPETAKQFGYDDNEKGLLVTDVKPGSKANHAGMRKGDLIKEINRTAINNIEDYKEKMDEIPSGETLNLLIKRPNAGFTLLKITK